MEKRLDDIYTKRSKSLFLQGKLNLTITMMITIRNMKREIQ
jgi:hypothetical protein